MTPTSKPAVTPEMVEKARLNCPNKDAEWHKQHGDCQACRYAASAVQDAVSEIAKGLEARAKAIELSAKPNPFADLEFHAAAAELREKYGVKP